jgi:2-dehydropantoate 2-reductase
MEIVVFGAGSLGSLLGGLLARTHQVTLVGRDPHMAAIGQSGLAVGGEFEFRTYPNVETELRTTADLGVVAVKAFDTEAAARALAGRVDTVVSVQNGMGNEGILQDEHDHVLAGTCTYGARLDNPGQVSCTGCGQIACGPLDADRDADFERATRVSRAFACAGLETVVERDMTRRRWEKLAVNAGINPVSALARVPNGALSAGSAHDLATRATCEAAATAREHGVSLTDEDAIAALETVIETTATNDASMYQDIQAGRRTEIDAISGFIIERARAPVPVSETLLRLIRTWERGHGVR